MIFGHLLAAGLLAAAQAQHPIVPNGATNVVATNNAVTVASAPSTRGVVAPPTVGQNAPDFAYQSRDYLWQNLHNMLDQGSVLLVFGANEDQLADIERDQESLLRSGIVPVAVVGRNAGDTWSLVRRHNLSYSLLADPHAAIAEQYGALDANTRAPRAMWFVIDHKGRVRGAGEGANPSRGWTALACQSLGITEVKAASAR